MRGARSQDPTSPEPVHTHTSPEILRPAAGAREDRLRPRPMASRSGALWCRFLRRASTGSRWWWGC